MAFDVPDATVPAREPAVGGLWLATGQGFSGVAYTDAAQRYPVVILNSWELEAARELRTAAPGITLLVYKDLASTRSYAPAPDGRVPTGVTFDGSDPGWFALDTAGNRIEWGPYPEHWQMTVWDPAYRRSWTEAVVAEVLRDGWDGVFADNDMGSLGFYSDAVVAGTASREETDELLRDGLDAMITEAGAALAEHGRRFVPNISEARLYPGRWTSHSRFGGALEENFAQYVDGELLTWHGAQWDEMLAVAAAGDRLTLLVSGTGHDSARENSVERTGFAGAALLAGPGTHWTLSRTVDYSQPAWSGYQSLDLGAPTGPPVLDPANGVWTRGFDGGWVGLNPTGADADVALPAGLQLIGGGAAGRSVTIPSADGLVLVRD